MPISYIVFGLTRSGLEPTIYHTRGERANQYTTDVVGLKGGGTQFNTAFSHGKEWAGLKGKHFRIKYIKTEILNV